MKYAKIEGGVVAMIAMIKPQKKITKNVEIPISSDTAITDTITQQVTEFAPDTDWIEIPDNVFAEFIQKSDGSFEGPPIPPIYSSVDEAKKSVNEWIDSITDKITGKYPKAEVASWAYKAIAAKEYKLDTADESEKAIIESEAYLKQVSPIEVCDSIIENNLNYSKLIGTITGFRSGVYDTLEQGTPETYEAILEKALIDVQPLLAQMGLV